MKRICAIGLVLILTLGFTTTAFASPPRWGAQLGCICFDANSNHHFWDADGNFLSRADVEANLNSAVTAGTMTAAERDLLLERFDFCAVYGGGAFSVRRGGTGQGFGRGAGRGLHCRW